MSTWFTWQHWVSLWPGLVEICLLFLVIYVILRFLQGTRGVGVLRGLLFFIIMAFIIILFVIQQAPFERIRFLVEPLGPVLLQIVVISLVILFQPELRRFLLRLGEAPLMRFLLRTEAPVLLNIVDGVYTLSKRKIGGLVVIERDVGLGEYIERGTALSARVTSDLLVTIFWPGSPLHDGGVIIRGNRIAAAGCLFPLTDEPGVARSFGTRHRAAIGITEHSDALAIVVSEETQAVSIAHHGKLRTGLERDRLRRLLEETLMENVSTASGGAAE